MTGAHSPDSSFSERRPWFCQDCRGMGWVKALPNLVKAKQLYGQDVTESDIQPTVTRCACRRISGPSPDSAGVHEGGGTNGNRTGWL